MKELVKNSILVISLLCFILIAGLGFLVCVAWVLSSAKTYLIEVMTLPQAVLLGSLIIAFTLKPKASRIKM